MNSDKPESSNMFIKELINNQIKSIEIFENLLNNSNAKVKEEKQSIVKTIDAVNFSLIERLDKFLEYSKVQKDSYKYMSIARNQKPGSLKIRKFPADKFNDFMNFFEEEINYLENLKDTVVFKNIVGKKEKKSEESLLKKNKHNQQKKL